MITLGLFEQMAQDGVAGLTRNKDFFWEEMPLQRDGSPAQGVWLVTRQGDLSTSQNGLNLVSIVDFYVGFSNKVRTEAVHTAILQWLLQNKCICCLSGTVGGTTYSYSNVRIRPTTTPENGGATENGTIVKIASARLVYDINN
jgi:hypothetical protein